ncbi:MAG: hypothetical protein ACR2OC_05160 [Solirubrobacterales bacterium]
MDANELNPVARVVAGVAGALLIATVFLAVGRGPGGVDDGLGARVGDLRVGDSDRPGGDRSGDHGLFRPDLSLNGAADLLAIASTVLLLWVLFDLPEGASAIWGVFAALAAAMSVSGACGDYRLLKGAPAFPSLTRD